MRSSTTRMCAPIGVEAAGEGIATGKHAASLDGRPARRAARQPHLCAAGRQRPDHRDPFGFRRPRLSRRRSRACLAEGQRPREYVGVTDDEALAAFHTCWPHRRHHAGAGIAAMRSPTPCKLAPTMPKDGSLLVNLSGRGDKDMHTRRRARRGQCSGSVMSPSSPERAVSAALDDACKPCRGGRTALIPYVTAGDPYAARRCR